MKIFLSGHDGVRRHIPETILKNASVMLSFYTAVDENNGKPTNRLKELLKARRRVKNGKSKS